MKKTKTRYIATEVNSTDLKEYIEDLQLNIQLNDIQVDDNSLIYKIVSYINKLPQYEQNILYLYAMLGTYSGVAKKLGVSVGIIYKYINNTIKKIKQNITI